MNNDDSGRKIIRAISREGNGASKEEIESIRKNGGVAHFRCKNCKTRFVLERSLILHYRTVHPGLDAGSSFVGFGVE